MQQQMQMPNGGGAQQAQAGSSAMGAGSTPVTAFTSGGQSGNGQR